MLFTAVFMAEEMPVKPASFCPTNPVATDSHTLQSLQCPPGQSRTKVLSADAIWSIKCQFLNSHCTGSPALTTVIIFLSVRCITWSKSACNQLYSKAVATCWLKQRAFTDTSQTKYRKPKSIGWALSASIPDGYIHES